MKQLCPYCGKKFNYEKNGYLCPECGMAILGSSEKKAQLLQEEQKLQKQQERQQQKMTNRSIAKSLIFSLVTLVWVVGVIAVGKRLLHTYQELSALRQVREAGIAPHTRSISPEELVNVKGSYLLSFGNAFPLPNLVVSPPEGGIYAAIPYTAETLVKDAESLHSLAYAVLCVEEEQLFLSPLSTGEMTGSSDVSYNLWKEQKVSSGLTAGEGTMVFLLPETVNPEKLTLYLYVGEKNESTGWATPELLYTMPLEWQTETAVMP